ncbi:DUF6009 family protein [Kitasatospora sp. NPDC048298]|uniref:DUF6009 family protein n=1 Tax=Kitasatospora sp. NPDC048298 TaxID=3364049 RepID=UPI003721690F
MNRNPDLIRHEDGIVWTESISKFDYVREYLEVAAGTRRGPVRWNGHGRRVGYSMLKPDAPAGEAPFRFARRVFWIKEHDRSEQPDGVYKDCAPSEGVDPRTVAAGVWGELTERAWGGPLPTASTRSAATSKSGPQQNLIKVGESLASGTAFIAVAPTRRGLVDIYIDCASGSQLGDGSHVISELLPPDQAHELLTTIIKTTPWLQEALALSVVEGWLAGDLPK